MKVLIKWILLIIVFINLIYIIKIINIKYIENLIDLNNLIEQSVLNIKKDIFHLIYSNYLDLSASVLPGTAISDASILPGVSVLNINPDILFNVYNYNNNLMNCLDPIHNNKNMIELIYKLNNVENYKQLIEIVDNNPNSFKYKSIIFQEIITQNLDYIDNLNHQFMMNILKLTLPLIFSLLGLCCLNIADLVIV